MVIGIGIDIVRTDRIARAAARFGDRFLSRVFSEAERAACDATADTASCLAGRFAAKEAAQKALGTGWSAGVGFRTIEILREPGGPPRLAFHGAAGRIAVGLGVVHALVSITHDAGVAAAVVVLEG